MVLVTPESATRGLHGTSSPNIFPIDETHSDMVKFSEGAPTCDIVLGKLREICLACQEASIDGTSRPKGYWMVPFGRNRDFVGRESILAQLLERILPDADQDDCQRTAIEGLGGIGKTQIALEAAFRVRDKHPDCSVFWVPAVDGASFENAYREIGRELGVEGIDDDKADLKALIRAALPRKVVGSWLLIIDNADDADLFDSLLPFGYNGSILFTTRNHEVAVMLDIPDRNIIPTTEMDTAEAIMLLRRGIKESQMQDTTSTTALLSVLTYLPLAIKQASAYMAKTGTSTTRYLEHCRSSDKRLIKLLSKDFEDQGRYKTTKNPVATTWLISFDRISQINRLAATYLKFMCFLAEKDIPLALLPPEDEVEVDEAIGILKAYAFLTEREQASYDMHRLVRLAMRNWLEENGELKDQASFTLQRLYQVFPYPKYENRDMWLRHLPHTLAALEFRDTCVNKRISACLIWNVAQSHVILGKYQQAEETYRETVKLAEMVLGCEHPDTLRSMMNLATVLNYQGKYVEAEQIHRQTLELMERILGLEHPDTLRSMMNLATVLESQGKYVEAEQIHRQTLELMERILGLEHPDTLGNMMNLATVLNRQGKYVEAEQILRQTLELMERILGLEHADTLRSMMNLATVLESQGKDVEAEQIHRQTLKLKERILGLEHPSTLGSMMNLATVLNHQGKDVEAEQILRQTLEPMERVLGHGHPTTLICRASLAECLRFGEDASK